MPDVFLVEGTLVCSACAASARRRMIVAAATFIVLAGVAFWYGWGPIVSRIPQFGLVDAIAPLTGWAWAFFLPPLILLGSADWTIRRMKAKNVDALEAIARARLLADSSTPTGRARISAPDA